MDSMLLFSFIFLALSLTIASYAMKVTALAAGGAIAWMVFAVFCYQQTDSLMGGSQPIYAALAWLGFAMVIVCALEPMLFNSKKNITDDQEEEFPKYLKETKRQYEHQQRVIEMEMVAQGKIPMRVQNEEMKNASIQESINKNNTSRRKRLF
jgi:hypothetical protein